MKLGWSAVVLVLAAVHLAQAWDGAHVLFGLCALLGFVAVPLTRWIPAGLAVLTMLVLAFTGVYFVARDGQSDPTQVLLDLVPQLLTAARPAPATPELLAPGALLIFGVSVIVAVSAARKKNSLFAPAFGAVVLYVCAALLTAGKADRYGLVALALVVLITLGWVLVERRGPVVVRAAVLVVPAAVALVAGVLPGTGAFEPRKLVRPPVTDVAIASPLPQLAFWAGIGDTELFRVRGPEVPLRLVALSDYTGAAWRAASTYGPIGVVAPPDLPPGGRQQEAAVEVTVGGLAGSWLPTVGKPSSVSLSDAMVDPDSGSLVLAAGLQPGLRYSVRGTVDTPDDANLASAGVPSVRRYVALPNLPFSLGDYARQIVVNARTPYEKAVAIEQVVRLDRKPDAEAPVGSSYARLETFLFGPPGAAGAGAGTAEQFASAFAVLARAVGLPTRVVVGFQPGPADGSGDRIVRGADATAWPEVYFDGWGWVPFDPVSGTASGPSAASKREVLNRLASTTASPPTTAASLPPLALPSTPPTADVAAPTARPFRLLWLGVLPVAVLFVLWLLRFGRRARLRMVGPAGAWAHVLDLLLLAGRFPRAHLTAPDVARGLGPATARLAVLADRAAFSPNPAPAPEAWGLAREVRRGLRRIVPWYRRLFWPVDPRPLWRR